jgi:hypothetical protein
MSLEKGIEIEHLKKSVKKGKKKQINNTFDHQEFVLQKSYVIGQVSFSGK